MNAQDAKKQAELNKAQMSENIKIRKDEANLANAKVLMEHFRNEINDSVKKGLLTVSLEFAVDRFSDEVVRDVAAELRLDGYNVNMEKHNAFQKVKFTVNWL